MADDVDEAGLLAQCVAADPRVNLQLYADFLGTSPHDATLPALALRDQARLGLVHDELIPVLTVALVDAPNLSAFLHLAKALAAFGEKARGASSFVAQRLEGLQVMNDRRFWILDGALWVFGAVGGDVARTAVDAIAAEDPPRVLRSKSVYQGELSDSERQEIFDDTIAGVRAQLDAGIHPGWRAKATTMTVATSAPTKARMAPWMIR
jgi:hypothetical protein